MMVLSVGTKSVLFGAHCVPVHAALVVRSYIELYGWPRALRDRVALVAAAVVHDLGYVGKDRMDDRRGENHVTVGAWIMLRLFGPAWSDECLYHSRFYARRHGRRVSRLGIADKLAVAREWPWFYLLRVRLSGEIREYMELARPRTAQEDPKYARMHLDVSSDRRWFDQVATYLRAWVAVHSDGRADTWTPGGSEMTDAEAAV